MNFKITRIFALALLFTALTGFMGMCEKKEQTGDTPPTEQPAEGGESMDDHPTTDQ